MYLFQYSVPHYHFYVIIHNIKCFLLVITHFFIIIFFYSALEDHHTRVCCSSEENIAPGCTVGSKECCRRINTIILKGLKTVASLIRRKRAKINRCFYFESSHWCHIPQQTYSGLVLRPVLTMMVGPMQC